MSTQLHRRTHLDQLSSERDVLLWRLEQFGLLGFSESEAFTLSYSEADLGRARSLRNGGCPSQLALRILL